LGAQTCLVTTRQAHDKKKSSGELGKKNQTNAGRVSQYISPLQQNVCQLSQGNQQT
jgi:5-keto 4-deoxyuronate isomerase